MINNKKFGTPIGAPNFFIVENSNQNVELISD